MIVVYFAGGQKYCRKFSFMVKIPKASLITIGDEILIGQIVDTNSAWLGAELSQLGVKVNRIFSIPDEAEAILKTLDQALDVSDIVITTGGLGPTRDDITKLTLNQFFNSQLVLHEPTLKTVEAIFERRGIPLLETNRQQAMVPSVCEVLPNPTGTAPGMWFEKNGKFIASLPGVPFEMKAIMETSVFLKIKEKFQLPGIIHHTMLTAGIGESILAEKIKTVENDLPAHIKLAYLPALAEVRLRLTGHGEDRDALQLEVMKYADQIKNLSGEYIYGEGVDSLEALIGRLLEGKRMKLSTAESCTGGYIAHKITSIPGSSAYFEGSILSYSNDIKTSQLGVKKETLLKFGAVSGETAREMVEGVKKVLNTDFAIATTGIAGPGGGTPEKPVGTVWIAVSGPHETVAKKYLFGDDRLRTIHRSAVMGLDMLRKSIQRLS